MDLTTTLSLAVLLLFACAETMDMQALKNQLTHDAVSTNEQFSHAISVIESLSMAPACTRLAVESLIGSCAKVASDQAKELAINDLKESSAARLAVCELSAAQKPPPQDCKVLLPTVCETDKATYGSWVFRRPQQASAPRKPCLVSISKSDVAKCIGALRQEPQSWTSYSNAFQNLGMICHAVRNDIERDELMQLHKRFVYTNHGLNIAYQSALENGQRFAAAINQLQDQGLEDLDRGMSNLKLQLASVFQQLQDAVMAANSRILYENEEVGNSVAMLGQNIEAKAAQLAAMQRSLVQVDDIGTSINTWLKGVQDNAVDINEILTSLASSAIVARSHVGQISEMHTNMASDLENYTQQLAQHSEQLSVLRHEWASESATTRFLWITSFVILLTLWFPRLAQCVLIFCVSAHFAKQIPLRTLWNLTLIVSDASHQGLSSNSDMVDLTTLKELPRSRTIFLTLCAGCFGLLCIRTCLPERTHSTRGVCTLLRTVVRFLRLNPRKNIRSAGKIRSNAEIQRKVINNPYY